MIPAVLTNLIYKSSASMALVKGGNVYSLSVDVLANMTLCNSPEPIDSEEPNFSIGR